jgi:hypothetical protein
VIAVPPNRSAIWISGTAGTCVIASWYGKITGHRCSSATIAGGATTAIGSFRQRRTRAITRAAIRYGSPWYAASATSVRIATGQGSPANCCIMPANQ